jgi:ABC-2 type transport system ATP-binding protein
MIEVKNLTKFYGSNKAVDNITFTADKGKILGFLGPNGAGKSTTMNILTGYISSTEGSALLNGIDILEDPIAAKRQIGYLPEQPPVYLDMTVNEYLDFVYRLKKSKLPKRSHLAEICELVKITDMRKRLIRNLSKGYRQRVGLAQALVGNPPILILDEPTVGLDPKQIIEIRSLIKKLGKNHTVILSSHILPEVQKVCDKIVIINDGKIVADGTLESLREGSNMSLEQLFIKLIYGDIDGEDLL